VNEVSHPVAESSKCQMNNFSAIRITFAERQGNTLYICDLKIQNHYTVALDIILNQIDSTIYSVTCLVSSSYVAEVLCIAISTY